MRPQKGPKRVDTNITGVRSFWFFNNTWENLLKGVEFRPEHFITDVSEKYPRLWALKGAAPNDVRRWYNFGALALIRTVAPSFQEISKLPDWALTGAGFGAMRKKRKAVGPRRRKIRHALRQATNRTNSPADSHD
ncbi:hypothetical protein ACS0TY_009169 [Phlomoides rotata]